MKRPIIGISCNFDQEDIFAGPWETGRMSRYYHYISENYPRSVERAGGIPLLLPVYENESLLYEALDRVDGILLSGGNDMDPLTYGEDDRGKCGRIIPERDRQDLLIAKYALSHREKPLLCICRGIQVLNVALGGSLYQDLEADGMGTHHSRTNYPINAVSHQVNVEKDSLLYQITGKEKLGVNSLHHQALKALGAGLRATAVAPDGVIEAVELSKDHASEGCSLSKESFLLAVQWHPEKMYDDVSQQELFKALVKACD